MSILGDVGVRVLSINVLVSDLNHLGSLTSHVIGNVNSCTLVDMHNDPRFFCLFLFCFVLFCF